MLVGDRQKWCRLRLVQTVRTRVSRGVCRASERVASPGPFYPDGKTPSSHVAHVRPRPAWIWPAVIHSSIEPPSSPHSTEPAGSTAGPAPPALGLDALGLIVAVVAAATPVRRDRDPSSVDQLKPFAHATASTELVLGKAWPSEHSVADPYERFPSARTPWPTWWTARRSPNTWRGRLGLPASKIGILGPLWTDLQRSNSGPQVRNAPARSSSRRTHTTSPSPRRRSLPPWPPVIDVDTQAPTTETAARLASAVAAGLNAYVRHTAGVGRRPGASIATQSVSSLPCRCSRAHLAARQRRRLHVLRGLRALVRRRDRRLKLDERSPTHGGRSKVGDGSDRSSDSRPLLGRRPAEASNLKGCANRDTCKDSSEALEPTSLGWPRRRARRSWRPWVAPDVPLHRLRERFHPDAGGLAGLRPGKFGSDLTGYLARANVFARLMTSAEALQYIGKAAGINGNLIDANGPIEINGSPARDPCAGRRP